MVSLKFKILIRLISLSETFQVSSKLNSPFNGVLWRRRPWLTECHSPNLAQARARKILRVSLKTTLFIITRLPLDFLKVRINDRTKYRTKPGTNSLSQKIRVNRLPVIFGWAVQLNYLSASLNNCANELPTFREDRH